MMGFFRNKNNDDKSLKKKDADMNFDVVSKGVQENKNIDYKETSNISEKMSMDLMIYIGEAIEKWARQYDMEQLPKNMLFKKALTLMNAWDRSKVFK